MRQVLRIVPDGETPVPIATPSTNKANPSGPPESNQNSVPEPPVIPANIVLSAPILVIFTLAITVKLSVAAKDMGVATD